MSKQAIGILTAVIVIAALVVFALMLSSAPKTALQSPSPSASGSPMSTGSPQANASVTIVYNDSGFSPAETVVKAGQSLTFTNRSKESIQVDSDPHPIHSDDPELNVGTIGAGQSKTITLTKTGSFGIHNHLNPSEKARVTIQ